ncbi:MAG: class I SAM-dependent methyltransferase [Bacteroidetes bacterium]|jgi:cyclopropane-fatty-acyl-phospholipid synthase|nr:class I SAM-dependent methyltransferase [Bacteroidota bacterium]MBK7568019.1 class I SAM-dependent methyltransferase [Bacteroidota bacterium]
MPNSMSFYKNTILNLLKPMQKGYIHITLEDGTTMELGSKENGLHADVAVNDFKFYKRAFLFGDIGFAEAYMAEEWTTSDLTKLLSWFLLNIENSPTVSGSAVKSVALNILQFANKIYHRKRKNSLNGSRKNISAHYDLSNDFFALFLDGSMTYSSAYFTDPSHDLEQAQIQKYESLCNASKIKEGDHVLEIGTGWGGFAMYAAKTYNCKITSVTISQQQFDFAVKRIADAGLSDKIEVQLKDYRLIEGKYDKVISIEMIEAVGAKYLKTYFDKIHGLLKPDGVLALQAIVCPDSRFDEFKKNVDFIQKHIFPGTLLPSIAAINNAVNETGDMFMFGLKDLGKSYVQTLAEWRSRFNLNTDKIKLLGFDDEFIRKWNYYFSYCEAAFNMRNINVVQMVYTRPNNHAF